MRLLFLFLAGCPGATKTTNPADTAMETAADTVSTDTEDTAPTVPDLSITFGTVFSVPRGDQIYDAAPASDGCAYLSNPYAEDFDGAVYRVCPGAEILPDDAEAVWTGSGTGGISALGCGISTLEIDGMEYLSSNEFCTPGDGRCDYVGRWLGWPADAASGLAGDVAVWDIIGDVAGSGTTGGYLGTSSARADSMVFVGATNADPTLYMVEGLPSALTDLLPVEVEADPASEDGDGFVSYDLAGGDDGVLSAAVGDRVQHVGSDGVPDWCADETMTFTTSRPCSMADRDVTRYTRVDRWAEWYAVQSIGSGYAHLRLLNVKTGEAVFDGSDGQYSYASGETADGLGWAAVGMWQCDEAVGTGRGGAPRIPSFPPDERWAPGLRQHVVAPPVEDCSGGWIDVQRKDGQRLHVSLPMEPPYLCAPRVVALGDSLLWHCQDGQFGGFLTIR